MTRDRNIELVYDGNIVGLRVDNWALLQTQLKTNSKGLVDLFHKIGIDDSNIDINAFMILWSESMNEYNHYKGIKAEPVDIRKVSEIIDDMGGIVIAMGKLSEALVHYIPKEESKNQPAPQMEGQLTTE